MPQHLYLILFGFALLLGVYGFLVKKLHDGFILITNREALEDSKTVHTISVVVPFRNEEKCIGDLMSDLFLQNYPKESFEVLLINDHSDDRSMTVAEGVLKRSSFSRCIFIHPATMGKKAAITEGVRQATGEIIVTVDADCRVNQDWLKSINSLFATTDVKMVFGAVRIEPTQTVFQSMQAIEFASLIGSGAATMAYGIPTMSNGANLAFRKDTFNEVGGYEGNLNIASGDDEFLMRKIAEKYKGGIRFNNNKAGIVATAPKNSLGNFIDQRIRWAGKWNAHRSFRSKLLAVFIFGFHASVVAAPFVAFVQPAILVLMVFFLSVKVYVEYRFLRIVNFWLKVPWSWTSFTLLQLFYSFYVVSIGIASFFVRPAWKGRKIKL